MVLDKLLQTLFFQHLSISETNILHTLRIRLVLQAYVRHLLSTLLTEISVRDVVFVQDSVLLVQFPVRLHYFLQGGSSAETLIGVMSRMQVVVSMRLHALIFAAGQGIPLAGVVYDPKVSSFLRYIGQDIFESLDALTEENLCGMIDRCMERAARPDEQADAVNRLKAMEHGNVTAAAELMGL